VREIADVPRPAETPAVEDYALMIPPLAVHDGRRVAIVDFKAGTVDLVDVFSGSKERMIVGSSAFGSFSPDGRYFAGLVSKVGDNGLPDPSTTVTGVFSEHGDCGDSRPFACLEWQIPQDDGFIRMPELPEPWSADGSYLLLSRQAKCTLSERQSGSAPCNRSGNPDKSYEVYRWPDRTPTLTLPPAPDSYTVKWAGSESLFVRESSSFIDVDGNKTSVPRGLTYCCASFALDRGVAISSAIAGEDCSLIETSSGAVPGLRKARSTRTTPAFASTLIGRAIDHSPSPRA
jgi:hypothetical protein